jgi:hypothetical protein
MRATQRAKSGPFILAIPSTVRLGTGKIPAGRIYLDFATLLRKIGAEV